jgi:hypothetical protein
MKNALRILLVVILIMPCIESYAQTFGVKGGLTLPNMLYKDNSGTYNTNIIPGFHIGATVGIPLSESIFFEPEIILNMKGSKETEPQYSETLNLYYLDVPLNLKVVFGISKIKVFGTLGPYIGAGLSGKDSWIDNGEKGSEAVKWGGDAENDLLKRLDYGAGVGAGAILSSVSIGISYYYGLANISSYTSDGTKVSNRVLQVSLGYLFGKK